MHVTEHPGVACEKSTLLTTVLNQISLLGGDNIFYSQLFLLKCWLQPASAVTHQQKFCFLHTRTLRRKEKPSVSHPDSPFLAPADPRCRQKPSNGPPNSPRTLKGLKFSAPPAKEVSSEAGPASVILPPESPVHI